MRALKTALCVLGLVVLLSVSASATTVSVANGGFETPVNAGDWIGYLNGGRVAFPFEGMETAGHGAYIGYVNSGTSYLHQFFYSAPQDFVQANTTYTLTVDVGKDGITPSYYGVPLFELSGFNGSFHSLGAGTYVANAEPQAGKWATWIVKWTTGANPAGLGLALDIKITTTTGIQTLYDNVRLDASPTTPAPEPSTLVLTVVGMIGLLCYAWRRQK